MKTIYWSSTLIISAFLFLSSYTYLFSKSTIDGIKDLGFPDFFRIELAVLKLIAAIILLLPFTFTSLPVKEWTYAGVGLFLVTAVVAHIAHKDSIGIMILLFILMGILIISNIYMNKLYI
ncbi:DoxX family protein [Crocinitomix catalasitica]|uniref:DoxX family protein n=1 Tax=Crocinitomix catalasitica TaxID=184607 RepID=UPI000482814B|nr:DoxX family protein [Crocinitomix catalasitica]